MMYVSDATKEHVTAFTQPALASSYFETFDERMALYVTGSIDYTNRNASEIVTCEVRTDAAWPRWRCTDVHPMAGCDRSEQGMAHLRAAGVSTWRWMLVGSSIHTIYTRWMFLRQ